MTLKLVGRVSALALAAALATSLGACATTGEITPMTPLVPAAPAPAMQTAPGPQGAPASDTPVLDGAQPSSDCGNLHGLNGRAFCVTAPLAGSVARVLVEEGQEITAGEVLLVLEAMKMETEITAPRDGLVARILVDKGTAVQAGEGLIELD